MFINFWYPVVRSEDLGTTPQKVRILAHDFVVFRDQAGKVAVLSDTCIHRGASLSQGKCKEDGTVQCPYHGWRFNAEGVCTRIPSIGSKTKPPPRARVDSYPVQEKYGIVFAFLGDLPEDQRPPIMAVDEHGTPEWRATVITFDVNYHYERSIENGLDPAHNEYVHTTHGYQGEREDSYTMMELRPFKNNDWGYGFMASFDAPPLKNPIMRRVRPKGGKMEAGSGTCGPNHMWTYINFSEKYSMHQYMFEAPIDESHTKVYLVSMRNWLMQDMHDARMAEVTMRVVNEDMAVVQNLNPIRTPDSNTKEVLVPGDTAIAAYREWLKKWDAKGWKIDVKALNARLGDFAVTIPCPARRTSDNWVMETVPLVPGTP
jgi:phenylpropionate dioxygenase-like ring-hydroxylating dioxygenase large terminal subunit